MNSITITKPGLKSFPEIFPLFRQLWFYKRLNKEKLKKVFVNALNSKDQKLLIAKQGGKIIGFAALTIKNNFYDEGNLCYVNSVVVDERYRKKGVGTAIMRSIIKIARKRHCKRIELDSAFFRTWAHRFYKSLGFVKGGYIFDKNI